MCYMWHQNCKAMPQFWVPPPSEQQLYYVWFLHTAKKSLFPTITTNPLFYVIRPPPVNPILQFIYILQQSYTSIQWVLK